eukprot:scaffold2554_cov93-Isochrysis_galbana.AAC.1
MRVQVGARPAISIRPGWGCPFRASILSAAHAWASGGRGYFGLPIGLRCASRVAYLWKSGAGRCSLISGQSRSLRAGGSASSPAAAAAVARMMEWERWTDSSGKAVSGLRRDSTTRR